MEKNFISLISRIKEKANRILIQELEAKGIKGIVSSHCDIMVVLFDSEKCSMKELAKKIHRTKATLTVLVDKLISLNLIEREKSIEDSRVTYIKLTRKGVKFKPVFQNISEELNTIVYKGFSEDELNTMELNLEKINQNFKKRLFVHIVRRRTKL